MATLGLAGNRRIPGGLPPWAPAGDAATFQAMKRSLAALAVLTTCAVAAPAHATSLHPFIDLAGQGVSVRTAAVGLRELSNGVASLQLVKEGTVQFAVLYWVGQDRPCPKSGGACIIPSQPYQDQQLIFDGKLVTGTIIGTEQQPASPDGASNNIAYRADVTSLVAAESPGPHSFTLSDANLSSDLTKLDGATLVVGYTDPSVTSVRRVIVFEGLDFALGNDATAGASRVTDPIKLNHGAAGFARTAQLTVSAGGASAAGEDEIALSGDRLFRNCLDASNGAAWDLESIPVNIPAGVGTTGVALASPQAAGSPDYLNWVAATLLVSTDASPVPAPATCLPAPKPPQEGGAPPPATPVADVDAPVLTRLRVGPKAARRARVRYALSESSAVRFVLERRRAGRFTRVGRTFAVSARPGGNSFRLRKRVRLTALRSGRYRIRATAVDAAGNRSARARARFKLLR